MVTARTRLLTAFFGLFVVLTPAASGAGTLDPEVFLFVESFDRLVDSFEPSNIVDVVDDLNVELRRDIPPAFVTDINQQSLKFAELRGMLVSKARELRILTSLLRPLSQGISIAPICNRRLRAAEIYPKARSLCNLSTQRIRRRISDQISSLSHDLSDVVMHEGLYLNDLRRELRNTQFQALKNVVLRNNDLSVSAALVVPPKDASVGAINASNNDLQCRAALLRHNVSQMRLLIKNRFRALRKANRKELLEQSIAIDEYIREPKVCPVSIALKGTCEHPNVGSREQYRIATLAIVEAVSTQVDALETSAVSMTPDDWRIARNIVLASILSATNLSFSSIAANATACSASEGK